MEFQTKVQVCSYTVEMILNLSLYVCVQGPRLVTLCDQCACYIIVAGLLQEITPNDYGSKSSFNNFVSGAFHMTFFRRFSSNAYSIRFNYPVSECMNQVDFDFRSPA